MKKEEAIERLEFLKVVYGVETGMALDMAIESLSADAVSREVYDAMVKHAKALEDLSIEDRVRIMYDAVEDIHNIRIINEVVRCNECKWYQGVHGVQGHAPCEYFNKQVLWNDFCSHGERAEQTDEVHKPDYSYEAEMCKRLSEQTEYKLPGHDEVMEALGKLTLDPIRQGTSKSEGHCFDCVHNEVCRYYDHIVGGCDFKETVEDLGARV